MDLDWNYSKRTCRVSMQSYIAKVLARYHHPLTSKPQLSLHRQSPIFYGAKTQHPAEPDSSPPLEDAGSKFVQGIASALLWFSRAVDNKLLVALSEIGSQKSATTKSTAHAMNQLLNYVPTYPNDGIAYRASAMVLSAHANAGYLNESHA